MQTKTTFPPSREQDNAAEQLALIWDRVECDAITELDGDMAVTVRNFGRTFAQGGGGGGYGEADTVDLLTINVDGIVRRMVGRVTL